MFTTMHFVRPFWQGMFLTAAFCLLGFGTAKAVTEQPVYYTSAELEELVGPVALYPDDLIGIVLPASSYPLQIVAAARYLEALETNRDLQPDEDWDDSVVALLNYPEVIELMNEDLDWTWNLGEAVVNQQADVLEAIQDFRGRAALAGNFDSDDRQIITIVDDVIEVSPVDPEIIYVPYYEPSQVIVYQRRPVYHYYPRPYPLYYYPYPAHYSFASGFFWGVTTAYTIGWLTDRVHYHHYGYASHPYYGYQYAPYYDSRRAHRVRHNYYGDSRSHVVYDRKHYGNTWKPSSRHGNRPGYRRADRRHTTAANYTTPNRRQAAADSSRIRAGGDRQATNRPRSGREIDTTRAQNDRNRRLNTRSADRRRQSNRTPATSRVATADRSERKTTSRRTRSTTTRSGSNQIIDTRSQRRTATRSDTRTPRRAGQPANINRRTARETRDTNSVRVTRSATRVGQPTRSANRTPTRTQSRTQSRTPTRTQPRTQARAQPRQQQRQASRPPPRQKSVASATRSTRQSDRQASNSRASTRVARAPARRGQSRSVGGSTRRGHRR